jgi:hypothetical protein
MLVIFKYTFNTEFLLAMLDDLSQGQMKVRLAESQHIDGIQHIGFTYAVISRQRIKRLGKPESFGFEIFKMV